MVLLFPFIKVGKKFETLYINDKKIGPSKFYDENGKEYLNMEYAKRKIRELFELEDGSIKKTDMIQYVINNLEHSASIENENPELYFILGKLYDYLLLSKNNGSNISLTVPKNNYAKKQSSYFEKVLKIDPYFDFSTMKNLPQNFSGIDVRSNIASIWSELSNAYKYNGKFDSAKVALQIGYDRGGFDSPITEYCKNILISCDQNAILFTNGDNDTYPLWYLQDIEKVRTDVTVINLSLLNASWYVKQLRDSQMEPFNLFSISDDKIDKISSSLQRWEEKKIRVPVKNDPKNEKGFIEWELKPTYQGEALRVQDMMVLYAINESLDNRPIYFSTTVSENNRLDLDQLLSIEGLVFKISTHKTEKYNIKKINDNLLEKYTYESTKNVDYLDMESSLRLYKNYLAPFLILIRNHLINWKKDRRNMDFNSNNYRTLKNNYDKLNINLPESVVPRTKNMKLFLDGVSEDLTRKHTRIPMLMNNYEMKGFVILDKESKKIDQRAYVTKYYGELIKKEFKDSFDGWNRKGLRAEQYLHRNGVLDGIFIDYYPDGKKKTEILLDMGTIKNINHWNENNDLVVENGNGIFRGSVSSYYGYYEGEIKNNLMVGNWKFFSNNNQLIATVEYDNYPGFSEWDDNENFSLFIDGGKIKELYFFSGEKHYEIKDDERIYYFIDGSVFQKFYSDSDGIESCKSFSIINPMSDKKIFYAEELNHKADFVSEYKFVNGEWQIISCISDGKVCESFVRKSKSDKFNFIEDWTFPGECSFCECE